MSDRLGTMVFFSLVFLMQLLFRSSASFQNGNMMITWNVTSVSRRNGRKILENVVGIASAGRLHAIMGPSGSGKTTLLNILAREPLIKSFSLQGQLYATRRVDPVFIQQEDFLFPQLTSRETLEVSLELRRQHDIKSCNKQVHQLLLLLGLKSSSETKVGDKSTRGLSGGEKKRLAIGNEIVDQNALSEGSFIFADEPTTGLDCFQAEKVMNVLSSLAKNGSVVVTTIHQPRASIVKLFDDITIISEGGKLIYSGPMEELSLYFSNLGFPCPSNVNPTEYYIDLVSVDYSSRESELSSLARISNLSNLFRHRYGERFSAFNSHFLSKLETQSGLPISGTTDPGSSVLPARKFPTFRRTLHALNSFFPTLCRKARISFSKFFVLFKRSVKQVARDRSLNTARLMSSVFSALLFGSIYYKLGNSECTVPDRLGLLQVAAVNTAMTSLIKATTSFVTEKQIIYRERKRNLYSVFSYFMAKLLAEIPFSSFFPVLFGGITYLLCGLNPLPGKIWKFISILVVQSIVSTSLGLAVGSVVPTVEAGIAVSPAVMVIFIVFGGLYVVNAPRYLRWIKEVSLIRWAFEGLVVNEFSGLQLSNNQNKVQHGQLTPGEETLQKMGFSHSIKETLLAQSGIALFNFLFTMASLYMQDPKRDDAHTFGDFKYFYGPDSSKDKNTAGDETNFEENDGNDNASAVPTNSKNGEHKFIFGRTF